MPQVYKLIVKNAQVKLKTLANLIINVTGIKDLGTGTGNVSDGFVDWKLLNYSDTEANLALANTNTVIDIPELENSLLLDLIKYTTPDTVIDIDALDQLPVKTDYDIRQKFMYVLDDMMDTINLKASKSAKDKKDKEMINNLMNLIEKQKLSDAFQRLEENRQLVSNEFAKKLQRNLKQLLNEKRANKAINERKAERERIFREKKIEYRKKIKDKKIKI